MDLKEERIYAVFGNPVAHSLSPLMHQAALERMGVRARYVPFCVTDLRRAVEGVRGMNIAGVSVTLPFKTTVIPFLDEVEEKARRIGAVNTLWNDRGCLKGHNTDWLGFIRSLRDRMEIKGKRFAVLGAGGAARAVVFGLLYEGGLPIVVNRTWAKAQSLAEEFGCWSAPWSELAQLRAEVLINTTPVGMAPRTEAAPLPEALLSSFTWVGDLIYRPLKTRLLKEAESLGCRTFNGVDMFVYQGAEQLKIWTGLEPPQEFMREVVWKRLAEDENY